MAVYHQMGYQSDNLLREPPLDHYRGAIISPVNYDQNSVLRLIDEYRTNTFELIFDPQLYYPRTERDTLRNWGYFPNDVDTVDLSQKQWWDRLNYSLARTIREIQPDSVCSPVLVPRSYSLDYYHLMTQLSSELFELLGAQGVDVLQTLIVNMSDMAEYNNVLSVASIVTRTRARRIYLILFSDNNAPRRELSESEEIKGAMLLIKLLEQNGLDVLVSHSSSDIILWNEAGASGCATGKFFNLRRFTPSRWEDNEGGGGQLPYWFEESLIAFLRESDLIRIKNIGLLSEASERNPYINEISEMVSKGQPWIAKGWRQFMFWFGDIDERFRRNEFSTIDLLLDADKNWCVIDESKPRIFFEERHNDGSWIRKWLMAVSEYQEAW